MQSYASNATVTWHPPRQKNNIQREICKYKQIVSPEFNFASRQLALTHTQKPKGHNVHSAVKDLKQISMEHRSQPLLIAIFTKPPIISNTKRKSRLWEENFNLKVTMQRDHKSHMESPCQSVLTFILGLRKPRVTWFGRYLVMRKW